MITADWSDADNRWTLTIDRDGEQVEITCRFLMACSGYYNYDQGYSPEFPGSEDFGGTIVHPQHWPEDLDYPGKTHRRHRQRCHRGDTDSRAGRHRAPVTSRCCSAHRRYIGSLPEVDPFAVRTNKLLPAKPAYVVNRWKSIMFQIGAVPGRPALPEVHTQDAA